MNTAQTAVFSSFSSNQFGACTVEHVAGDKYRVTNAPEARHVGMFVGLVHVPARDTKTYWGGTFHTPARSCVLWAGRYVGCVNLDPLSEPAEIA